MKRFVRDCGTNRREFLWGIAAAGGLAAAAGGARASNADADDRRSGHASSRPQGYRLTPHVAKYYAKARF